MTARSVGFAIDEGTQPCRSRAQTGRSADIAKTTQMTRSRPLTPSRLLASVCLPRATQVRPPCPG